MTEKRLRILIAKPGLDGHDRGAKTVAYALKEAGMEVIYTGLHQSPEAIARTALQEDVDLVGLSILSGAHLPLIEKVLQKMKETGIGDKPLLVGGVIPRDDRPKLEEMGIKGIFPTGSKLDEIIRFIKDLFPTD